MCLAMTVFHRTRQLLALSPQLYTIVMLTALDYKGYLQLDELLKLQQPIAEPPAHDETLFIVVHQVFELWFRLLLHEIDRVFNLLDHDDVIESERLTRRLTSIVRLFIPKLSVLETMLPSDFIQFRDRLRPASGFQSVQFREIEFASGLKDRKYLSIFKDDPDATARLERRFAEPAFWDHFIGLLERQGYSVGSEEAQRQAIVSIYKSEGSHALRILCEAMIEYDEMFSLWREHHVRMAQRMIGSKPGTGQGTMETLYGKGSPMGTIGVDYLIQTLTKRFFPVLWAARTEM
jgi:tryptophan 2,3-dioxygenase